MFGFKKKNYLKRIDFINLVDSNKIWSKSITISEINILLEKLENELLKYDFDIDKNFIMNTRRKTLKGMIEDRLQKNEGDTNELASESLFNFWEFVQDEYFGDFIAVSKDLGLSIQELTTMDDTYRKKGIICVQEKDSILNIIQTIKKYIVSIKSKENNNTSKIIDEFETNNFIKIQKNRKIIIEIYNDNCCKKRYEYKFETNVINSIPETDIKFAIALEKDNDEYLNLFINLFNPEINDCSSPTRTYFSGLTDTYSFYRYIFDYSKEKNLKIGIDTNNYIYISGEDLELYNNNIYNKTTTIKNIEEKYKVTLPQDYIEYVSKNNGYTGMLNDEYVDIWSLENIIIRNTNYQVENFSPNLIYFGSNGGDEAYAFDKSNNMCIVSIPFIGTEEDKKIIANNFNDFINR